jgi:hypothetical protein
VEVSIWCLVVARKFCKTYLTSKTVFSGFIAAWFLAASPMRRSSLVKETKEGVVKEPCSHTDFDIGALVVGDARVGRACGVC